VVCVLASSLLFSDVYEFFFLCLDRGVPSQVFRILHLGGLVLGSWIGNSFFPREKSLVLGFTSPTHPQSSPVNFFLFFCPVYISKPPPSGSSSTHPKIMRRCHFKPKFQSPFPSTCPRFPPHVMTFFKINAMTFLSPPPSLGRHFSPFLPMSMLLVSLAPPKGLRPLGFSLFFP